ncbi:uncharacterized protein N7482_003375 [Penicillium canariense]|uniref:Copper-fist domain-containing protein n=1 Tax=Penicillium canariense TaxID=189055 RepID=A0A9W9I4J1_9EURO|nr:uncharacterized protein N7482_003375 [Penicillium canariense]KAJ5167781.1 hypothetical protein N7482_003375 [Penicillium canariense]
MLIDGHKWACEACIRGHRVTSCKHHDRPLIRIKRKGRPFATCSICNSTPCEAPTDHARLKREAELKTPSSSSKKATHNRLYPRHHNPTGFLPIAPRPSGSSKDAHGSSARVSRSGSTSAASASSSHTPVRGSHSSSRREKVHGSVGDGSGSEGSGNESGGSRAHPSASSSTAGRSVSADGIRTGSGHTVACSALETLALDAAIGGEMFDPRYTLVPAVSGAGLVQAVPLISPLAPEGATPFDFPLDPALTLDEEALGYLGEMDVEVDFTEGVTGEVFHVEDWSRYMWSPETGFEHLDTGYPPSR